MAPSRSDGRPRTRAQNADSGCADIPRHSQSLRSPANVMCAGKAHPASLLLARVSCARNESSGIPLTVRHQIKIASTSGLPLDAVGPGPL